MGRCVFRPQARAHLRDIGRYIARSNRARARSFVEELRRTCQRLADHPLMGRAHDELRPGLRSFPHGDYLILHRPLPDGVTIVRILHGARDAGRLL